MNMSKFLTKAMGAGAILLSVNDAHKVGVAAKNKAPQSYVAKNYPDLYINSQRLDRRTLPSVVSKMKNSWFNFRMDDSAIPALCGISGYISGLSKQLVSNVIPLSLGLGALTLKGKSSKLCALMLVLGAAKIAFCDILGIGKYKQL